MRVIHTMWTAGKTMTSDGCGWLNAQTGLMSWALSACCAREHFDDLVLYTDSEGARVLVDGLHLPYTEVVICYDNLRCHPAHWAYAKMLSYSKQTKPFIHIDGDVYLPCGLSENYEHSALIAQNKENGTAYYKGMMERVMRNKPKLPAYLSSELNKRSIGSYNAGVLGGCDTDFVQYYCDEAFKIIRDNGWDDPQYNKPNANHNLLFEQILFYALAHEKGYEVSTLLEEVFGDNKYTFETICDIPHFDESKVIHLLGGYKQNRYACALMRKTLLRKFPKTYMRVLELLQDNNCRVSSVANKTGFVQKTDIARFMSEYEQFLNRAIEKWNFVGNDRLLEIEHNSATLIARFSSNDEVNDCTCLIRHPYVEMFSLSSDWTDEARSVMKARTDIFCRNGLNDVAVIPTLDGKGYREIFINDLQYDILMLLERKTAYSDLLAGLEPLFSELPACNDLRQIVNRDLKHLSFLGLVCESAPTAFLSEGKSADSNHAA